MKNLLVLSLVYLIFLLFFQSCTGDGSSIKFSKEKEAICFENSVIKLEFDERMMVNVFRKMGKKSLSIIQKEMDPYYVIVNGSVVNNFEMDRSSISIKEVQNKFGLGKQLKLTGTAEGPLGSRIAKSIYIDMYEKYPSAALVKVEYKNVNSTEGLFIEREVSNSFDLNASLVNPDSGKHDFWILQGGSYKSRPDWILPVSEDFSFENFQGQRIGTEAVGGGLPVLDVWCRETGLFIGSMCQKPTPISLPARVEDNGLFKIQIQYDRNKIKFENEPYVSIPTLIGVHGGDFYNGLRIYSELMACHGFEMIELDSSHPAYEAVWCGWGFGPDFTTQQMYDMIPLLHELKFKVVTVDLGWFYKNGDYIPRDDTFPAGNADMRKFVKTFHDNGFRIKVWITTCIAGPELQKEHPEWLLRNPAGEPIYFDNYNSRVAYLCPSLKEVQEYHRQLVRKCIGEWGYDGFKVDQQIINAVSNCYAVDHHHSHPSESFEDLPEIYRIMHEEIIKIKPDAIIEVCPCGVFPSFYKMPYYNQPVSSDFKSQWQIRHRGKTIKALMGPSTAYYGDHVERYYKESNFASMIGVGGIPGTMMVAKEEDNYHVLRAKYPGYLYPEKRIAFEKWLNIYGNYQLSKGEYLNLYDLGYDVPEAHAIKKDNIMYYAFYASKWDGEIEFRGLDDKNYTIVDYVNNKELGKIRGNGKLPVSFEEYLLVKAVPDI